MNHLKVQSYVEAALDEIVTELFVDGHRLTDFRANSLSVDLCSLQESTRRSGEFYIVTCVCGYPACAGIKQGIQVSHYAKSIEWIVQGLGEEQSFIFDLQDYRTMVDRGIQQLKSLMESHNLEVAPEINKYKFGTPENAP